MQYLSPDSIEDAVRILSDQANGCHVLAGGTDLLVRLRSGLTEPDVLMDIKRISELSRITREPNGLRVGAAVSCAEMGEHADLSAAWPGVVEAAGLIGSTQIQGRATIAGNLCNASPAADSVPALVAANGVARVVSAHGVRDVPVEDIPASPGKTSLAAGEFLSSIFLPDQPGRTGDAYLRFIPRTEMDIAVVGCGVALSLDAQGVCTSARIALGAVAPTVVCVPEAAEALVGTPVDDTALARVEEICSAAARPITDKRGTAEFRTHVAGVLARRTAKIAAARAGEKA
ncbi:MAG: xanthine dehydrogenase family protein subunit M [Pseudomonadota bacterium]